MMRSFEVNFHPSAHPATHLPAHLLHASDATGMTEQSSVHAYPSSDPTTFDPTKADSTKADSTKADSTKADSTKADSTKADSTKADSTKADSMTAANPMTADRLDAQAKVTQETGIDQNGHRSPAIQAETQDTNQDANQGTHQETNHDIQQSSETYADRNGKGQAIDAEQGVTGTDAGMKGAAIESSNPVDVMPATSTPSGSNGSNEDEPEHGLLPVLKNTNFLTLWGGQVFSQLADKVYLVLMIALIASRFQSEGQTISGWVSSLMIAFTIPAILFGSIAGVFVDHWRKRMVLVSTNLLRGGLVLSLPIVFWLTQGWTSWGGLPVGFLAILGITFLVSTLTQFFAPAEQAVIPLIVDRRHLLSANSLYTMTMMASVIIGFALGEPVLALADQVLAPIATSLHLGVDFGKEFLVGGSYVMAGLMLMLINPHETTIESDESLPDVWQNIRDGLRYLKQQRRVRAALLHLVILFSVFAALAVLAVRLAEIMPEIKSSQFGFLLAAGGVGMAIGAVLVGQFGQRFSRAQLGLAGSIGMGVALAAVSFSTQHLIPTLPLLVVLGACAAVAGVPMQTAIQEETPEAMRGKVFGLQNNAINIALSLPLALAGIAETLFGIQAVFLGLAILSIGGGLLTWSLGRSMEA